MTNRNRVLRDVQLQSVTRRLQRTVPKPAVEDPKPTPTPVVAKIGNPVVGQTARLNATDEQSFDLADVRARAYAEGVEAGRLKAKQEATNEIRRLAEHLAVDLAKDQVRQAFDQAASEADKRAQQKLSAVHDHWQRRLKVLDGVIDQLPHSLQTHLSDAEDDMLALVHDIVCKVLGEECADISGLRVLLREGLKAWHGSARLSIELHPDDLSLLENDETSLALLQGAGFDTKRGNVRWVASPEIKIGGVRLRSVEGALDARLEMQLQTLKATLLHTRASRRQRFPLEQSP